MPPTLAAVPAPCTEMFSIVPVTTLFFRFSPGPRYDVPKMPPKLPEPEVTVPLTVPEKVQSDT